MQKLTEAELRLFLERSAEAEPPANYMAPEVFAKVLNGQPFIHNLALSMMGLIFTMGPPNAALSIWATGFQMGRAFESDRRELDELDRLIGPVSPAKRKGKQTRKKEST